MTIQKNIYSVDRFFAICIYIFVISQFFENIILISTKTDLQFLYPIAFSFKYIVLLVALLPRFSSLKIPFSQVTLFFSCMVFYAILVSTQPIGRIATSLRDLAFFAFLHYLFSSIHLSNRRYVLHKVMQIVLFMTFTSILYAIYIVYTNDGTPGNFYFYNYLISIDRWGAFNYFRNNVVRAFGLFSSPITYSNFLILPISFMLAKLGVKPKFTTVLILVFFIWGLFQTQTRNPPVAILVAIVMFLAWKVFKRFFVVIFAHLFIVFFSFYGLSALYSLGLLEPSAAGRVDQTKTLLPTILENWHGLGLGAFGAQFSTFSDLSLLTVFLTFGILGGILYYGFIFYFLHKLCKNYIIASRIRNVDSFQKIYFVTVFLTINSLVIVSINSNVFDSVTLPLIAVITGLYSRLLSLTKSEKLQSTSNINTNYNQLLPVQLSKI